MLMMLAAYQLGWYGYATLQQPVPCPSGSTSGNCSDGCVGFMDLLLPSRVDNVDACIISNWSNNNGTNSFGQKQGPGFQTAPTPISGGISRPGKGAHTDPNTGRLLGPNGQPQYDPRTGEPLYGA